MAYFGLIDPQTGDLVSTGTESMFDGGVRPEGSTYANYEIIDFGPQGPNFALKVWERAGKRLVDRPVPIVISRLDDIETRLLNDSEFSVMWASLNATRKAQLRNGWRRVVGQLLGGYQFRDESEKVEL